MSFMAGGAEASALFTIRVAVVDTRRLIAEALASVLAAADPSIEVVTVASGHIVPARLGASEPDIVLVGVGVDVPGSLALVDGLVPRLPAARIVIVADVASPELVRAVLERSIGGLLLSDGPAEELAASLRQTVRRRAALPTARQGAPAGAPAGPLDSLSDRQLDVLRLLADGCSYEEIGRRLVISVNTVKFHTRAIFARLGVRNRISAARILTESVDPGTGQSVPRASV